MLVGKGPKFKLGYQNQTKNREKKTPGCMSGAWPALVGGHHGVRHYVLWKEYFLLELDSHAGVCHIPHILGQLPVW